MQDYLIKALAFDGQVRAYAVSATEMVKEAQRRQGTWRTASAALGRSMVAGVMMGAMQKGETKVTIKIEGGGPIGSIIVDANANGDVRGYVTNPHVDFESQTYGKLEVSKAVGNAGTLSVVKDMGMRNNFVGSVPLCSGELGDDFTYYFASSEQTPTSVALGVLVNGDDSIRSAGGFIVQLLPNTSEEVITKIEEALHKIPPISWMIDEGKTPEEMLQILLGEDNVHVLEKMPIQFQCNCSRERIANAIISLGEDEIRSMIEEVGHAEAGCHFCGEKYMFEKSDLETLISESLSK